MDLELMFLSGKVLLMSSPFLGKALFSFDSALLIFKAHCVAELRLEIFKSCREGMRRFLISTVSTEIARVPSRKPFPL
jgi:hypothetical protein